MKFGNLDTSDRKRFVFLMIWLIAGLAMVINGIFVLFNRDKTMAAVSGFLGTCALITGVLTVTVRIYQARTEGRRHFSLDFLMWFAAAFLFYNTDILNKIGKIAFIILGIINIIESVRVFAAAQASKGEEHWYVPRVIFAVVLLVLGVVVIVNAESIFKSMIVLIVGVLFIVNGFSILIDWFGRVMAE